MLPLSLSLPSAAWPSEEVVRAAPTAAVLPAIVFSAERRENDWFMVEKSDAH